jgi:NCAIR mutase (PurE)-related protein
METDRLRALLEAVQSGARPVEEALKELADAPIADLGFARLDLARQKRRGIPEVVYCSNKTAPQVIKIVQTLSKAKQNVLCTRVDAAMARAVRRAVKGLKYSAEARTLVKINKRLKTERGPIMVACAGTSDIPVAEEAAVTAEFLGNPVVRAFDVGVAGIHRLLAESENLRAANVIIVCAGMEGALPSVVAGLVSAPVIAVPTSIGYGASFGGLAALLGMLNSCSSGVAVMNIDNGFGAAVFANAINEKIHPPE